MEGMLLIRLMQIGEQPQICTRKGKGQDSEKYKGRQRNAQLQQKQQTDCDNSSHVHQRTGWKTFQGNSS